VVLAQRQEAHVSTINSIKTKSASRVGVAILAAVATAVVVGGVGFASIPDGSGVIHGCYMPSATASAYTLKVINTAKHPKCPVGYNSVNWNQTGPQGPSGVVRMDSFAATAYPDNATTMWAFVSQTVPETFTNTDTAATVTGTIDFASSNGSEISAFLGVCYEASGSSTLVNTGYVGPQFTLPANSYVAQTVSATVGNLSAGTYNLGLCTMQESSNVEHGDGHGTIILAQTQSGSSSPAMPTRLPNGNQ
jgi:hypothetical protein